MLFERRWKTDSPSKTVQAKVSPEVSTCESQADTQDEQERSISLSESAMNEQGTQLASATVTQLSSVGTLSSRSVVEICETSECEAVFDRFLNYLYSARIQISPESAVGILILADKYNVAALKDLAVGYMVRNARSPRVQNALSWYYWAKMLNLPALFQQCFKTVVWNLEEIIKGHQDTWLELDLDFLCDILGSSEIVITNEYTLFEAVHNWLLHEKRLNKLATNAEKLLKKVRFAQMLVSQLYAIEQCDLWNCSSTRELMHSLVARAYRFRSLSPSQRELTLSFAEPFFTPRDYVQLTVDTLRISNTLRFGLQVDVKMYAGACPQPVEKWTGEWKIMCRKQQHTERSGAERWTFTVYCHDSAMTDNEARFQVTILVYNSDHRIIQVEATQPYTISRGVQQTVQMELEEADAARELAILIKPLPLF